MVRTPSPLLPLPLLPPSSVPPEAELPPQARTRNRNTIIATRAAMPTNPLCLGTLKTPPYDRMFSLPQNITGSTIQLLIRQSSGIYDINDGGYS
jgi:hypothetical protein